VIKRKQVKESRGGKRRPVFSSCKKKGQAAYVGGGGAGGLVGRGRGRTVSKRNPSGQGKREHHATYSYKQSARTRQLVPDSDVYDRNDCGTINQACRKRVLKRETESTYESGDENKKAN